MKRLKMTAVVALLAAAFTGLAQLEEIKTSPLPRVAPSGNFTYAFSNAPLWDFSGAYAHAGILYTGTVYNVLFVAPNGKVTGFFEELDTNYETGDYFNGTGIFEGTTYGGTGAGATGMNLTWQSLYFGTVNGIPFEENNSVKGNDVLDAAIPALQLHWNAHWCVVDGPCTNYTGLWGSTVSNLPPGMNGNWALNLNLSASGAKMTGTAALTLSNDRTLNYNVIGRYTAATQVTALSLTPLTNSIGSYITLTAKGSQMTLTGLSGNVLGQKIHITHP